MKTDPARPSVDFTGRFPPSAPCSCDICRAYCVRPGWWTVAEAEEALKHGLGNRMMLEISPEGTFGVLSPAFYGCEGGMALSFYQELGCNFLKEGLCELFESPNQPLECRFCHHERKGEGLVCHRALELDWNTTAGQTLVSRWGSQSGFFEKAKKFRGFY